MTKNAEHFVSRLTFETLSGSPVLIDEFHREDRTAIGHIEITNDLDAAIVAPATANVIGKIAAGIADDALTSALVAINCPLVIAPAMNDRMYGNPFVKRNMATLQAMGARIIEPETGSLACGVSGQGRLAETERIIGELSSLFVPKELAGYTVLVTAGPTREAIDAVRYISNPASGKMGYALAAAARARGANVLLISGPTHLTPPTGVKIFPVVTAGDMHDAVLEQACHSDIIIMAAAVSDFKAADPCTRKIKKDDVPSMLKLERTADILAELGAAGGKQFLVGFAAETDNIVQNALKKITDKNLDIIVVNDVLRSDSGFGVDTNAVTILDRYGGRQDLPTMSKSELAGIIIGVVAGLIRQKAA